MDREKAPHRSQVIVPYYPKMGQPDLGSETHIFDVRSSHIGIPPNNDFRRSAASSLAPTARHAARRAAGPPVPEHIEEWAKVWRREHEASGHARARRERLFAIYAKMHICAPPPARSRRAQTAPPGSVASYPSKSTHSRALALRAKVGGRSGVQWRARHITKS